jgi:hypothetical protein
VTQTRWLDNFVVSTKPIGPVVCPANPVLIKTPYRGAGKLAAWEVELAGDRDGEQVVWRSNSIHDSEQARVDPNTGNFVGALEGKSGLTPGSTYYCRVRQSGISDTGTAESQWSPWHQGFAVAGSANR